MDWLTSSAKSGSDHRVVQDTLDRPLSLWEQKQRSWGFSDKQALPYTNPQAWIEEFDRHAARGKLAKNTSCPVRLMICYTGQSRRPTLPSKKDPRPPHWALLVGPVRLDWRTTYVDQDDPVVQLLEFDSNAYPLCVLDVGEITYNDSFLERLARIVCTFNTQCKYAKTNSRDFVNVLFHELDLAADKDNLSPVLREYLQDPPGTMTFPGFKNLPEARFDRHQDVDDFARKHNVTKDHPAHLLLWGFDRACHIRYALTLKMPHDDPERGRRMNHWKGADNCAFVDCCRPFLTWFTI